MSGFKVAMIGDPHLTKRGPGGTLKKLVVPEADLILILGDWVTYGPVEEYKEAVAWAKSLKAPLLFVRGNHDNGLWHHHVRQVCEPSVADKLESFSSVDNMRMVLWKPHSFEVIDHTILYLEKKSPWNDILAQAPSRAEEQRHVIKLRDMTRAYYAHEAGGLLFLCLDIESQNVGTEQLQWLESQIRSATKPVVLVGHQSFLPVNHHTDSGPPFEQGILQKLILESPRIIAYLHAHVHFDQWWKYGHVDVICGDAGSCRMVEFSDGKVVGCTLDGRPDTPKPFTPKHLAGQPVQPGRVVTIMDTQFEDPWGRAETQCLGWLPREEEPAEIVWTQLLDADISPAPHRLLFRIRNQRSCQLRVTAPGLDGPAQSTVAACESGQEVSVDIGALSAGLIEARLSSTEGWGYADVFAHIRPTS